MSAFGLFAVLITLTALLSWLNERFIRLPSTIGVLLGSLVLSAVLVLAGQLGWGAEAWAERTFSGIDFNIVLMKGMLSFLLFAGALHVDIGSLIGRGWTIFSMATVGVVVSTFLIGGAAWLVTSLLGLEVPWMWALVFGALITPTDPIAVLGVLKTVSVPKDLEAMIAGESLFNDGVGVVVFTMVLGLIEAGGRFSPFEAAELFVVEAVGGVVLGLGLGYVAYWMLKRVDNYVVEVLVTLALVAGGYALAGALHSSGPIAMVVAGLFIGNHGRTFGMSAATREHLDTFWELIDEVLNALLFVMIGLEVLVLRVSPLFLFAGVLMIPLVVTSRFVSVALPLSLRRRHRNFSPYAVTVLSWAGVRGGISIALALALPSSPHRDLLLVVTYVVVVFSILVQGLTIGKLARWVAVRS